MDILVKGNGLSKSCEVVCDSATSIGEVKKLFEHELDIPSMELRLFFGDKELRDLQKIGDIVGCELVDLCFLRRDPEQAKWLEAVSEDPDGRFLREAPAHIAADREVILAAVQRNGRALEFAAETLRADKEIVLSALEEDAQSFRFASSELHADRDVMLAAVRRNGLALQFAVEELRDNQEMVLAAVAQNGQALRFASQRWQAEKDVVQVAVENDPGALHHAVPELRDDVELQNLASRGGS
ncbi:unnamed protein product [Cladocopium goreaui]|uniref:DUF4116 domain-containing protein n=1 Tax=Cladocopium goreaui TaxID=2562237 RepID=A0A9P1GER3_9DINO|nr:unnamed protein product [Cladocopium goreaui]